MQTELNALGIEYDWLLVKSDKTVEDYIRMSQIERLVMSDYGFSIADAPDSGLAL
jgi:hypothetical protein